MKKIEKRRLQTLKRRFTKIAQDLQCSEESVKRFSEAENMIQLENMMITARKTIPEWNPMIMYADR